MYHGDSAASVHPPEQMLQDIKDGFGDWGAVPPCVRGALLNILSVAPTCTQQNCEPPLRSGSRRVLLPLRNAGPTEDLATAVNALREGEVPLSHLEHKLKRTTMNLDKRLSRNQKNQYAGEVVDSSYRRSMRNSHHAVRIEEHVGDGEIMEEEEEEEQEQECYLDEDENLYLEETPSRPKTKQPVLLKDRQVYYSSTSRRSPHDGPKVPNRSRQQAYRRRGSGRVIQPIDLSMPTVKRVECLRHRREVINMLLRVHEAIKEIYNDAGKSLVKNLRDSMRVDPRRAKNTYGEVKPLRQPVKEQEEALQGFAQGVESMLETSQELVAAFLTPEEKLFLGVDSHKFQTRKERETNYQYHKQRNIKGTLTCHLARGDIGGDGEDMDMEREKHSTGECTTVPDSRPQRGMSAVGTGDVEKSPERSNEVYSYKGVGSTVPHSIDKSDTSALAHTTMSQNIGSSRESETVHEKQVQPLVHEPPVSPKPTTVLEEPPAVVPTPKSPVQLPSTPKPPAPSVSVPEAPPPESTPPSQGAGGGTRLDLRRFVIDSDDD
ncbi:hypothetical protein ERJ75_000255100 [Trypanosoma vivax]|nr:hypothetical protein ERJ75_000255100 [Trypanosoma vivax]